MNIGKPDEVARRLAWNCMEVVKNLLYEWELRDCEEELYEAILLGLMHEIGAQEMKEALNQLDDETAARE